MLMHPIIKEKKDMIEAGFHLSNQDFLSLQSGMSEKDIRLYEYGHYLPPVGAYSETAEGKVRPDLLYEKVRF